MSAALEEQQVAGAAGAGAAGDTELGPKTDTSQADKFAKFTESSPFIIGQHNSADCSQEANNNNLPLAQLGASFEVSAKQFEISNQQQQSSAPDTSHKQPPPQQPPPQQQQQQPQSQQTNSHHIEEKLINCKQRQLSYLQILLLRNWPCLAILICVMCSLLFGMLLSALTVYFMHGMTDCSGLALAAAASGATSSPLIDTHDMLRHPAHLDGPLELASVAAPAGNGLELGRGHYSAALSLGGQQGQQHSAEAGSGAGAHNFRRLPASLWPVHYDLFIQPHIAEPFNFSGKVSIRIRCAEPTDNITLHSVDLSLNERTLSLKLAGSNSSETREPAPKIKAVSQDRELQYSIVKLDRQLERGAEYVLGIDFAGTLSDELAGFYKIKYESPNATNGEITWVAATQFQATDARRAFPCFDEPLYKATFSIQIKHWKNMTALSNMPIIDRQDSPDGLWVTDTFEKSHRMSTYLVAYAVTNFESRSEGNISVWTRPGLARTAEYALKIAGKILRHYEDFFGIEYPLPKMDMIALPDFNAGAMENWGLITYRETAMLYDEASSSVANKQRVAVVVAHELAHQWFGNLVTPKWWDDLWLNEGFASYVEYIGVDFVEPMWRMMEQFVVQELQNVFKMDSLASSHQISIPVNNPDEISEIFDNISYSKGSSIIRMMSSFLTDEVFKAGLKRYLKALKYSNAEQRDLWAHLTEAQKLASSEKNSTTTAVDVERVMNSWTLQTGYPLVTLTRKYANGAPNQPQEATIEQVRHQAKQSNSSIIVNKLAKPLNESQPVANPQKWEIPITFTSKSEQNWQPTTRLWLHQNDSNVVQVNSSILPLKSDDDWILLNVNQVGYYRVNYDIRNWKLLLGQLMENHTKISTINRAQIIDDIFELAKGGFLDYRFVMNATKYIKKEFEFLPYDSLFMSIAYIDDMLRRTPIYGDWLDYMSQLMIPYYNRYKDSDWTIRGSNKLPSSTNGSSNILDTNDVLAQYNQVNAIAWACQVDDHCKQKSKSLFNDWRQSGKNSINPALRYTVYCTSIENGSKDDWNFLWKIYAKEQNANERDRILRALACTREHWLLARYLEWTFDKTKPIRRQDGAYVFKMIGKNEYGREIAFHFMRERWATIREQYGKSSFSMGNLVRSIANSMNTHIELVQLKNFFEQVKGDVGTGKRAFQIAIDEVESNIAWTERSYKILEEWLQGEVGGASSASARNRAQSI